MKSRRPVNENLNRGLQFLQTLQNSLAPVAQISGLTAYSQTASALFSNSTTATALTDTNYTLMPDDVKEDTISLKENRLTFVFTQGNTMFAAFNPEDGKKMWISSGMIQDIVPLDSPLPKRQQAPFLYLVKQGNRSIKMIPTGKEAVMVVRLKKYLPYANIDSEQMRKNEFASIPQIGGFYANLIELGRKYKGKTAFAGAVAEATDEFAKTIRIPVGTGDLSRLDARKLVGAFSRRIGVLTPGGADKEVWDALDSLKNSIAETEPKAKNSDKK